MAKVKNLLHQPLILDFSKNEVIRFNAREVKEVRNDLIKSPVFKRNEKDLLVLAEPQVIKETVKEPVNEKKKEKQV